MCELLGRDTISWLIFCIFTGLRDNMLGAEGADRNGSQIVRFRNFPRLRNADVVPTQTSAFVLFRKFDNQ